ncbi:anti-sigma factor [Paenibacillaceae bacterium]|nr:anti-sigma factor [Paenibacillaceae bacterium]
MKCNVAIKFMHEYLDDDLPREDVVTLKEHMLGCPECRMRFEQLKSTEAFVHAAMVDKISCIAVVKPEESHSALLTNRIMQGLPSKGRTRGWSWIRKHPASTVAAVFLVVMLTSFFSMWNHEKELVIRGTDLQQLVIEGDKVTVPEGVQIHGNLTVENGTANVHGEVLGNLTVIDGSLNLASTARIIGENREINQALDWLWFKITQTVSELK